MPNLTKKDLLKSVQDDKAEFLSESHGDKDCWDQVYSYQGYEFIVWAFTSDRWLHDDADDIQITKEPQVN